MLGNEGARLDGIYYCPHHPSAGNSQYTRECDCRKPATGLLDRAAKDLDVDLRRSFMIGDKWSDVELGHRAGCRSVLVRTGFAHDDPGNVRPTGVRDPDFIANDLADAIEWVFRQDTGSRPGDRQ
jgi:D-glycero-D-manno-heptose 1,7-bisphosphate phosphatase